MKHCPPPTLSGTESHWEVWHEWRCLPHLRGWSVVPAKEGEPFLLCGSPSASSASVSKSLGSLVFLGPVLCWSSLSCCSLTCRLFAYIFLWLSFYLSCFLFFLLFLHYGAFSIRELKSPVTTVICLFFLSVLSIFFHLV